jgi:hypothetical protein
MAPWEEIVALGDKNYLEGIPVNKMHYIPGISFEISSGTTSWLEPRFSLLVDKFGVESCCTFHFL